MAEKHNWQRAYHNAIDTYRRQWLKWKRGAPSTKIRVPQIVQNYVVGNLSDEQIRKLAVRVAQLDMERAINVHNASLRATKVRTGEAQ